MITVKPDWTIESVSWNFVRSMEDLLKSLCSQVPFALSSIQWTCRIYLWRRLILFYGPPLINPMILISLNLCLNIVVNSYYSFYLPRTNANACLLRTTDPWIISVFGASSCRCLGIPLWDMRDSWDSRWPWVGTWIRGSIPWWGGGGGSHTYYSKLL